MGFGIALLAFAFFGAGFALIESVRAWGILGAVGTICILGLLTILGQLFTIPYWQGLLVLASVFIFRYAQAKKFEKLANMDDDEDESYDEYK